MKILIVHEIFMPSFGGGGERIVYEMAKNLLKRDIKVKVITTGNPKIKEYDGIRTIRLPINRYLMNFAFFSILKHARCCDLIQATSYNAFFPSWLAGKILGKPVICYAMGIYGKRWIKMRGLVKGTASRIIEKIQLKRSYDKIIFLSDYSKEWAREIGIYGKRTGVVNPGIELKEYKCRKKERFVLFSGRFAKQKGVDDIIKVARKLPNIKFVMIGWGEEEKRIKKIAPPNIEFYNGINNKKMLLDLYSKADVGFFPSIGETFGLVIVEAMASGCAIVSTIPLKYEGFIVKSGCINEMAEKIKYLMENKKITKAMRKKNIELAKKYTWKNFTDKLLEIYDEILEKK